MHPNDIADGRSARKAIHYTDTSVQTVHYALRHKTVAGRGNDLIPARK